MSHLSQLKTQIKDKDCIVKMLRSIFGDEVDIRTSDNADLCVENRYGGAKNEAKQYANIVLKTANLKATADIGFVFNSQTGDYGMIWDGWSLSNHLSRYYQEDYTIYKKNNPGTTFNRFVEHFIAEQYAIQVALKGVRLSQGQVVEKVRLEEGGYRLRIRGQQQATAVRSRTR